MSAATVLRMVLLRRAADAAQSSTYVRLMHAPKGWHWWSQEESNSGWTGTLMCLMTSYTQGGGSGHFIRCGGDGHFQ